MIPYYRIPVIDLGPIPIDPWAAFVCVGFVVGMEVARARGRRLGLDVRDVVDGVVFTVGFGFLVGHLVHVLAYHPEQLREQGPIVLLKLWAGFSSFGGFLGALLGVVLFYRVLRKRPFWPHADVIMYGLPFGWFFGRLGCASVHDHLGRLSTFPLAIRFPEIGPRHDLGLYEAILTLGIAIVFWVVGRRERAEATFILLWCFLYGPARFLLDFLRAEDLAGSDLRYAGLTPAQYGCIVLVAVGLALVGWRRTRRDETPAAPVP
ncbi:MAG: prolipoprotein diacylglyceryl transferase [Deltaproteobacteria bacterium]|nr:prolipoprotein diacylglyceryl transferase [Deltaproteobacteria bacterium]